MRRRQIATLARFTLLEAVRTRLAWLFAAALCLVFGVAWFLQQLAITESARVFIASSAAATRLVAVFVAGLHVLTSIVREFNDHGLELTLSFDLRRSDYILGRLLGFVLVALLIAFIAALPQWLLAPQSAVLQWWLSLSCELVLMVAFSLFCIVTFTQFIPAAIVMGGFYVLARSLSALRLISDTPIAGGDNLPHQLMARLIDGLALLVPALDRYAQSAWLVDGAAAWQVLAGCAAQTAVYTVLLGAAAMFDFYRRNL